MDTLGNVRGLGQPRFQGFALTDLFSGLIISPKPSGTASLIVATGLVPNRNYSALTSGAHDVSTSRQGSDIDNGFPLV